VVMAAAEGCCWEAMGTNASEDGAQSATATARERNCMMMVLLVYRLFGGDGFFLDVFVVRISILFVERMIAVNFLDLSYHHNLSSMMATKKIMMCAAVLSVRGNP
jgi:hypothetical protein